MVPRRPRSSLLDYKVILKWLFFGSSGGPTPSPGQHSPSENQISICLVQLQSAVEVRNGKPRLRPEGPSPPSFGFIGKDKPRFLWRPVKDGCSSRGVQLLFMVGVGWYRLPTTRGTEGRLGLLPFPRVLSLGGHLVCS